MRRQEEREPHEPQPAGHARPAETPGVDPRHHVHREEERGEEERPGDVPALGSLAEACAPPDHLGVLALEVDEVRQHEGGEQAHVDPAGGPVEPPRRQEQGRREYRETRAERQGDLPDWNLRNLASG